MAVSAFRSTTRRSYQAVSENTPTVTGSKQGASSQKGTHRKSRSSADFSQKYLSDSDCSGRHGRRSSDQYMSYDSESDVEVGYRWRRYQRRDWKLNDGTDCSPAVALHNNYQGHHDLKRFQDLLSANLSSLKADPFAGNLDSISDALWTQVKLAVDEIRMEFDQYMKQSHSCKEYIEDGSGNVVMWSDVRKEYIAKLEQSEKRVNELRCQWAVEESRLLEFSNIVKQLLRASGPSKQKTSHRRKMKVSAEKQLVSQWLDEEAHKYFEDCVSISSLESSELDASYQKEDQHCSKYMDQIVRGDKISDLKHCSEQADNSMVCRMRDTNCLRGCMVENDGVDLSLSQRGTRSVVCTAKFMKEGVTRSFTESQNIHQNSHNHARESDISCHVSSNSNAPGSICHNNSSLSNLVGKETTAACVTAMVNRAPVTCSGKEEVLETCDRIVAQIGESVPEASHFSLGSESCKSARSHKNLSYINVEDKILERIRLQDRIQRGELILCMGIPF